MREQTAEERALHLLCEGQSIRSITRMTGASMNTVIYEPRKLYSELVALRLRRLALRIPSCNAGLTMSLGDYVSCKPNGPLLHD
jgi:hypothetical protein